MTKDEFLNGTAFCGESWFPEYYYGNVGYKQCIINADGEFHCLVLDYDDESFTIFFDLFGTKKIFFSQCQLRKERAND